MGPRITRHGGKTAEDEIVTLPCIRDVVIMVIFALSQAL